MALLSHLVGYAGGTGAQGGNGGGIFSAGGTVTLRSCLLYGNHAGAGGNGGSGGHFNTNLPTALTDGGPGGDGGKGGGGGAIYLQNGSVVSMLNCTLNDNHNGSGGQGGAGGIGVVPGASGSSGSEGAAGGALSTSGTTLIVQNSTVVGNWGGGIASLGSLALTNSIVTGNDGSPLIFVGFTGASNLISSDPLLAVLGDYGGLTQTMPPLAGSPAIDAGLDSITNSVTIDQRGYPRRSGAHVDIGAVEAQVASAADRPLINLVRTNGVWRLRFTNVSIADFTVLASTNVALPSNQWTPLGRPTQGGAGLYQFTDSISGNRPIRFYQLVSP